MWNPFRKKLEPAKVFAANYDLAFNYLPSLIEKYNQGDLTESIFSDVETWKNDLPDNDLCQYDWKHTKCIHRNAKQGDGVQFVLISFSEKGEALTAPKFGFIFINKFKHTASFYTLEYSFGKDVICQNENGRHMNYGPVKESGDNEVYSFIKQALDIEGIHL